MSLFIHSSHCMLGMYKSQSPDSDWCFYIIKYADVFGDAVTGYQRFYSDGFICILYLLCAIFAMHLDINVDRSDWFSLSLWWPWVTGIWHDNSQTQNGNYHKTACLLTISAAIPWPKQWTVHKESHMLFLCNCFLSISFVCFLFWCLLFEATNRIIITDHISLYKWQVLIPAHYIYSTTD